MQAYTSAMKRTSIFLAEEHFNGLRALQLKTGAPIAELIRRAIEEYLKKQK
jgi:predicted DNA-binding protein